MMRRRSAFKFASIFLLITTLVVVWLPVAAQSADDFDGAWEGALSFISGPRLLVPKYKQTYRITIKGNTVEVADAESGAAVAPAFQMKKLKTNAVLLQMHSGTDRDGAWVETKILNLTRVDRDLLPGIPSI